MDNIIQIKDNEYRRLVDFMKSNYGINLEKKRHLIEGRLTNLIIGKGFHTFDEYLSYIFENNSKKEISVLVNKLTTNHTYFMREKEHFAFFEKTVLPWMYQKAKDKDLRIWSAGCSSGEEPYTIAMIMQNFFKEESTRWDKKILATDICEDVLRSAIQGIYSKESTERLSEDFKMQFFHKIDKDTYRINDKMKDEVIFRIFNLMDNFPFRRKFHAIFCRNVMIYFDKETKRKLVQKFYDMTVEGGYLFIGMSESMARDEIPYQYVMPSVYRKG